MHSDDQPQSIDIDELVDLDTASASRRIFADEAIYQLELDRIFSKAWLYIGHVSEIPEKGDFVTRQMARDPVIMVRANDGEIRVLLNSCPHRGTMVCQADAGNNAGFTCPYHGWAFDNTGRLVATAAKEEMYEGSVDFRSLDMRSVARVGSYAGLVYATWNEEAPSLDEYLGDVRWFIDLFFNRTPGGAVVLGAAHRWEIPTNWKIGALNFSGDGPHFIKVHGSIASIVQQMDKAELRKQLMASTAISWGNGHNGVAHLADPSEPGGYLGVDPAMVPLIEQTLQPAQLDARKRMVQGVNTIFPNNSWTHNPASFTAGEAPVSFLALRVWQPLAANLTQVWNWYFADAESSDEWKRKAATVGIRAFSVGGTFDMDDAQAWRALGTGVAARQVNDMRVNFPAAPVFRNKPREDWAGPGRTYNSGWAEASEFDLIREWRTYMLKEPSGGTR